MGLLRYRETGEVITETEFRFRNRKRRPHNVPPMGQLTREWLDGEGVDPVLPGPKIGPVYNGAYKHSDGNWYTQWSNN